MFDIVKNLISLIKNIMNGDEYISDKAKITSTLTFISFIHLFYAVLFVFYGGYSLILYNLVALFLYHAILIPLANRKHFFAAMTTSCGEMLLFSVITTLLIGSTFHFNLFCFCTIPAIFYVVATIKDFKNHSLFSLLFAGFALLAYSATLAFEDFLQPLTPINTSNTVGIYVVEVLTGLLAIGMIVVFLFLFTWEMKNNNATLEKRNQQLQQFANVDPLTKLPNRRSMMQTLNLSMHELQRGNYVFSIILCDIDDFKKINDNYGHDMGDKVLLTVAHTISSQLRDCDAVCRWGGEEILILIRGDLASATAIAERIRLTIATTEVNHNGSTVRVSMTFGVTQAELGFRIEQIIQSADNRMYYGKNHGKNQVVSTNH